MHPYLKIPHFYISGGYASYCGPYATSILVNLMHHLNNKTGDCFPSEQTIADEMGITRNTVRKYVKPLLETKITVKKKKKMKSGKNGYKYILNTPEKWKKLDNKKCSPHEHISNTDVHSMIQQCSSDAISDVHQEHTNKKKLTKRNNNGYKNLNSVKENDQLVDERNNAMDKLTGVNSKLREKFNKKYRLSDK